MEDGRREVKEGASLFVILCAREMPRGSRAKDSVYRATA